MFAKCLVNQMYSALHWFCVPNATILQFVLATWTIDIANSGTDRSAKLSTVVSVISVLSRLEFGGLSLSHCTVFTPTPPATRVFTLDPVRSSSSRSGQSTIFLWLSVSLLYVIPVAECRK